MRRWIHDFRNRWRRRRGNVQLWPYLEATKPPPIEWRRGWPPGWQDADR